MLKLSDIIKSGGGNAKINRFINRYIINKKEKKDILNVIKSANIDQEEDENNQPTTNQELEYFYVKTSKNITSASMQIYFKNCEIVAYKGPNQLANNNIMEIKIGSTYTTTVPKMFKIIKAIVNRDGIKYDNTSFEKFILANDLDASEYFESTKKEYDNYK